MDKKDQNSNVIKLDVLRKIRTEKGAESEYRLSITKMEKFEVLQELLKYDEIIKSNENDLQSTIRAKLLMEALEERAELRELKELAGEYKRKLANKLYTQMQNLT